MQKLGLSRDPKKKLLVAKLLNQDNLLTNLSISAMLHDMSIKEEFRASHPQPEKLQQLDKQAGELRAALESAQSDHDAMTVVDEIVKLGDGFPESAAASIELLGRAARVGLDRESPDLTRYASRYAVQVSQTLDHRANEIAF